MWFQIRMPNSEARKKSELQPSLRDSSRPVPTPSVETLGCSRVSLRDGGAGRCVLLMLSLLAFCGASLTARAVPQFDVFLGYDGLVPEASWFPVVCEIKNDGASFTGTVELTTGNQSQTRRLKVELPTGTLKRVVLPVFSTTHAYSTWDVRLLDERGRLRAEQLNLRARKQVAANVPLIGALPRTAGGVPTLRPTQARQAELQPATARLQSSLFPDNPLVLEGLDCLYLNSEKASELRVKEPDQVNALYAWVNAGGHLIVAVEQISDITSTPWLRNLVPCELTDMRTVKGHPEFQEWLRRAPKPVPPRNATSAFRQRYNLPNPAPSESAGDQTQFSDLTDDMKFEAAEAQVAVGTVREGRVVVSCEDMPMIVTANRGRGRVTALMFSPEREPFRSWKNLPAFWARLAEVPGAWYASSDFSQPMRQSSDGIFGAMIDSRQVHKLPIEWLLLLLIVYLVVIGPLDQFWLKRIGRPMLTWITFPCYVVLFSLLIYFIGYKLRAGESEWNELHLVDVLLSGDHAELRGRTYASVYAPSNQRYSLESEQKFATFRGEFVGMWSGGQSSEKANVMQNGDSFRAEIFVPVWTSQLFVSDWWHSDAVPLSVTVAPQGEGWRVSVVNHTDNDVTHAQIVLGGFVSELGDVAAGTSKSFTVTKEQGTRLKDFVSRYSQQFRGAVGSRQRAFGESGQIEDLPHSAVAASFISQMSQQENDMHSFIAPPGLDLSSVAERGEAIVLAWADGYAPVKPMYQFSPRRSHRQTLWRIAVPIK